MENLSRDLEAVLGLTGDRPQVRALPGANQVPEPVHRRILQAYKSTVNLWYSRFYSRFFDLRDESLPALTVGRIAETQGKGATSSLEIPDRILCETGIFCR
jgi:hypothetical protein